MIESPVSSGLPVDLLLSTYRVSGSICQIGDGVRLGDYLISRQETIALKGASVCDLRGQLMSRLPEMLVQKRAIIAAVPRESEDFQQRQRLTRLGMVTRSLARVPVVALVPPFAAIGIAHVSPSSDLSDPESLGLDRFFPLTDACLYLEQDCLFQGKVVMLNRDLVAAIGRTAVQA